MKRGAQQVREYLHKLSLDKVFIATDANEKGYIANMTCSSTDL